MTRVANQFIDPVTGYTYDWQINHNAQGDTGRKRQITETALTSGPGLVRQQGARAALKLPLSGTIMHEGQRWNFLHFYGLCEAQTIHFREFSGELFEVLIEDYQEQKHGGANRMDSTVIPWHYYSYSMLLNVITPITSPWAVVKP